MSEDTVHHFQGEADWRQQFARPLSHRFFLAREGRVRDLRPFILLRYVEAIRTHLKYRDGIKGNPSQLLAKLSDQLPNEYEESKGIDWNAIVDGFWLYIALRDVENAAQLRKFLNLNAPASLRKFKERFMRTSAEALTFSDAPFLFYHEESDNKLPEDTSKSLKIAYLLHNSQPLSTGGYAIRAEGVARGLIAQGAEVYAITRPGFPKDTVATDVKIPERETVDGLSYFRLPRPVRHEITDTQYILEAVEPIEKLLRELQPNLVMAASNYLTARPAQIAARRLGLPFVYEVRGFWEITGVSRKTGFQDSQTYKYLRYAETETARRSDLVFTLTYGMKKELMERGVPAELIRLAPNSVDPLKFRTDPRDIELAERWEIPSGTPVIGYIGSFASYEGLELLADACSLLNEEGVDFRLLLVGSEDVSGDNLGPIASYIRKTARENGFEDKLIMPGRVPFSEVPSYYSLVDVVTLPRRREMVTEIVSPIKPFEAMAMAKCLLVSNVGALAEIVQDGETGVIFEDGSADALKDSLWPLLHTPELRRKIGEQAKEWVTKNRSWQKTTREMYEQLERVRTG